MTKQHFIALADCIREYNRAHAKHPFDNEQIDALSYFCQQQNQRFNRTRWLDYIAGQCGPNGGKAKTS